MQFGKTMIGAIIGAALGIGLLFGVYLFFGLDQVWLAIPVALLTGLGVRTMVATSGHASYTRGAITVLLALGAYLGGWFLVAAVAKQNASNAQKPRAPLAEADQPAAEPGKAEAPGPEAPAPAATAPQAAPHLSGDAVRRATLPRQFSTWDFISLAVAALLAYELGRGTGGVSGAAMETTASGPASAGTHPDA